MSLLHFATKNVVTCSPQSTVRDAARLMREFHVGDVIVTEKKEGREVPVGIVTDRDIVMSTVAFDLDPRDVLVKDVMVSNLTTARVNDPLFHVLNLMREHGIKRIPLTGVNDSIEGILCADDLVGLLASELSTLAKVSRKQRVNELERRRKVI